jgi:hypothetical protein
MFIGGYTFRLVRKYNLKLASEHRFVPNCD